jgi:hypothetical protein
MERDRLLDTQPKVLTSGCLPSSLSQTKRSAYLKILRFSEPLTSFAP